MQDRNNLTSEDLLKSLIDSSGLSRIVSSLADALEALRALNRGASAGSSLTPIVKAEIAKSASQVEKLSAPTFVVSGTSGVGKSALINCLLGVNLLPSDARRASACTQFPCYISYAKEPLVQWEMYAPDEFSRIVKEMVSDGMDAEDENSFLPGSALKELLAYWDIDEKATPEEILYAGLSRAIPTIAPSSTIHSELERLTTDPLRMFVKKCQISGPFKRCAQGETLIDLPGEDDVSSLRLASNEETKKAATAHFIVTDIKRCLTSRSLLEQFTAAEKYRLARNTALSSTFIVCTRSDDIDDEEEPLAAIIVRNGLVREKMREMLRADDGLLVFCASTKYFLHWKGIKKFRNMDQALLRDVQWTEIPRIGECIDDKVEYLKQGRLEMLERLCQFIISVCKERSDAFRALETQEQLRMMARHLKDIFKQMKASQAEFDQLLQEMRARSSADRLATVLTQGRYQRSFMRWNTYKAHMARCGVFSSNMNAEVASRWFGNDRVSNIIDGVLDALQVMANGMSALSDRDDTGTISPVQFRMSHVIWRATNEFSQVLKKAKRSTLDSATTSVQHAMAVTYRLAASASGRGCHSRMHGAVANGLRGELSDGVLERSIVASLRLVVASATQRLENEVYQGVHQEMGAIDVNKQPNES